MKKTRKIIASCCLLLIVFVGIGFVNAKLLWGITTSIASGNTLTSPNVNATGDNAVVELTPGGFTNTSNAKKSLVTIEVKDGTEYTAASTVTENLSLACHTWFYNDIGAGTWRLKIKQANARGTIKYVGITNASIGFSG